MKTGLTIALLLLLFFSGCQNDEEDHTFFFDVEEDFRLYQKYSSLNGDLTLSLDELSDSRCPEGATCIWQGEARVTIRIEHLPVHTLELSTFDNVKDTFSIYSFELIKVKPYPDLEKVIDPNDYVVTLLVSEIR